MAVSPPVAHLGLPTVQERVKEEGWTLGQQPHPVEDNLATK